MQNLLFKAGVNMAPPSVQVLVETDTYFLI